MFTAGVHVLKDVNPLRKFVSNSIRVGLYNLNHNLLQRCLLQQASSKTTRNVLPIPGRRTDFINLCYVAADAGRANIAVCNVKQLISRKLAHLLIAAVVRLAPFQGKPLPQVKSDNFDGLIMHLAGKPALRKNTLIQDTQHSLVS